MNWQRGLARIYATLWVLLAAAGAYLAFDATRMALKPPPQLQSFLQAHPSVTVIDLRTLPIDSLETRLREAHMVPDELRGQQVKEKYPGKYDDISDADIGRAARNIYGGLEDVDGINWSADISVKRAVKLHQVKTLAHNTPDVLAISRAWLTWFGICIIMPAIVLFTIRWIVIGFQKT